MITFKECQAAVKKWNDHNFPIKKAHQPLLGIGEEVGELMHAHLKDEQGIRGTKEEHTKAKMDAIGDMLVYTFDYANQNGLDVEECFEMAWHEVSKRDWQKFPKNGRTE
jgi:NTP pyrophosphatase (non-canonical NTP hydrolase)